MFYTAFKNFSHTLLSFLFLASFVFLLFLLSLSFIPHALANTPPSINVQSVIAQPDEHIVWQRAPIQIILPVGQERLVTFPEPVTLGINGDLLSQNALRIQNDNQTLYLLAQKPFSAVRTQAKLKSGEVILLDISAQKNGEMTPIDIILPNLNASDNQSEKIKNTEDAEDTEENTGQATVNYVTLTRFAIQQLYAPKRLLKTPFYITRFPMEAPHLIPLFYDASALALPLASWRAGDFYVTAILIKNTLAKPLSLDPRLLCGQWQAATFYPQTTLTPHGDSLNQDTTTLFLVSTQPFIENMSMCFRNN